MVYDLPADGGWNQLRVEDLCTDLGYPPSKDSLRSGTILSKATCSFRKEFIRKAPDLKVGELRFDVNDPKVLRCARDFAETKRNFFERSILASSNGWPIYPDHQER